jgi:4-methyl-5(b-hydroxyethyl)-thiazole monophosphate biosynthesis
MSKRVAMIFGHGVEELELIAPADVLRRAGCEVLWVTWEETRELVTRGGFSLFAHQSLAELDMAQIDLLVLPGGPGVMAARKRPDVWALLADYATTGKPLAAICAAPLLLHDAGLLAGRRFACHGSCHAELPAALKEERVVVDGTLITSRGAGTALEFGLALVEQMCGDEMRREIELAIEI